MRGLTNDCLRRLIGCSIALLGVVLSVVQRIRMFAFFYNQKRLRKRYKITADTPVLSYGPEQEQLIQTAAAQAGQDAKFALTSGSTSHPKRTLYTKRRLRSLKLAYIDVFARCVWALRIKRTSLYVFSSLSKDDSLTSMSLTSLLLNEERLPPYLSTLQAPYRVQCHPAIRALASVYGTTALRLWIVCLANPGVLYSTNPSTISTFLDELTTDWEQSSRLVKDWCEKPEAFHHTVHMIAGRLKSRGCAARLARIAKSDVPLPLEFCAPAVEAYLCWTGGYVKPFLDRLAKYLPPERYRLIPMYSMSTETIATVNHFYDDKVAFVPLASRVLYEFVEESAADQPGNLRSADQLQLGKTYSMIVSDPYGLRRYQTGDVFLCSGMIGGLPDLRFLRRRGLAYSFTGEKLTAEHVSTAFQRLREESPLLKADTFLTCIPSQPPNEPVPHYKVLIIGEPVKSCEACLDELAIRCDQLFGEINCEYESKRKSGRLGRVRFMHVRPRDFVDRLSRSRQSHGWEAQFKFLPLYQRPWELINEPAVQNRER